MIYTRSEYDDDNWPFLGEKGKAISSIGCLLLFFFLIYLVFICSPSRRQVLRRIVNFSRWMLGLWMMTFQIGLHNTDLANAAMKESLHMTV